MFFVLISCIKCASSFVITLLRSPWIICMVQQYWPLRRHCSKDPYVIPFVNYSSSHSCPELYCIIKNWHYLPANYDNNYQILGRSPCIYDRSLNHLKSSANLQPCRSGNQWYHPSEEYRQRNDMAGSELSETGMSKISLNGTFGWQHSNHIVVITLLSTIMT